MRKILTIALTIIFLISGVGLGSTQHYCMAAQKTMTPGEMDCCSNEPEPQPQAKDSCCEVEDDGQPVFSQSAGFTGSCCVLQQTFQQVDISAKPHQSDINPSELIACVKTFTPKLIQSCEKSALITTFDPATFQNLPLLI